MNSLVIAVATAIILGTLGWIGSKSADNNDKLTRMEIGLPYLASALSDLKTQMAGLVTRGEMEAKFNELKNENAKQNDELRRLNGTKQIP